MNFMPDETTAGDHHLSAVLPALRPRLWPFALRLAGNRRDALDLVQRVCSHAFEHRQEFPTGFPTPSAMFSLVHFMWFHEVRPRRLASKKVSA
jgi:RNA polymerase sigma-70 factor (ECF subfamily)